MLKLNDAGCLSILQSDRIKGGRDGGSGILGYRSDRGLCTSQRRFSLNEILSVGFIGKDTTDLLCPEQVAEDSRVKGGNGHDGSVVAQSNGSDYKET